MVEYIVVEDRKTRGTKKPYRMAYLSSCQLVGGAKKYELLTQKWASEKEANEYITIHSRVFGEALDINAVKVHSDGTLFVEVSK